MDDDDDDVNSKGIFGIFSSSAEVETCASGSSSEKLAVMSGSLKTPALDKVHIN